MERRPLASRGTKWAQTFAQFIAERSITPNFISVMSVVFSLISLACYAYAYRQIIFLFIAAAFIQLRLLCNLLDGMVAVEFNKKSIFGNLFNDIPDRLADVFIIMGAGLYAHASEASVLGLNALTLAWINSILAVFTAYLRVLGASVGTPMFFQGPMAKPHRMALLTVATLLALIPNLDISFLSIALILMLLGQALTSIRRIKSIADSLVSAESK